MEDWDMDDDPADFLYDYGFPFTRTETLRTLREHYARWLTTGDFYEYTMAACYARFYMPKR